MSVRMRIEVGDDDEVVRYAVYQQAEDPFGHIEIQCEEYNSAEVWLPVGEPMVLSVQSAKRLVTALNALLSFMEAE